MGESLFQRKAAAKTEATTPYDLIGKEIDHLKKGKSSRHGSKGPQKMSLWLIVLVVCAVLGLYALDPIEHAWYKDDAIKSFVYLHFYGVGKEADELANCGILAPEEVVQLEQRHGSYQDYYVSAQAAADQAREVLAYVASVKQLHTARYENLNLLGKIRYQLFLRWGLPLPTAWNFLDPGVAE